MKLFQSRYSKKLFIAQLTTLLVACSLLVIIDYGVNEELLSLSQYLIRKTPVLLIFIGILIAAFPYINRVQTGPIQKLTRAAREMTRKGRTSLINIHTGDEFEILAHAFNQMSHHITTHIQDLEKAQAQLRESDQVKTRFLASLSHELRTPLNAILVSSEFLQEDSNLNQDAKEFADLIHKGGEVLRGHLDHIFRMQETLDNSQDNFQENFYLMDLAKVVFDPYRQEIKKKGLDLDINIPNDIHGVEYHGYYHRLYTMLNILVDNAVKFTQFGFVRLEVACQMLDRNKDILTFTVADSGNGIEAGSVEAIFEPFFMADDSDTRSYGGLGLGLALANNHAKFFGSKIRIESEPTKGSRFTFELIVDRQTPRIEEHPNQ